MKNKHITTTQNKICVGIGLVALDLLVYGKENASFEIHAGGSCGNVMSILSYFGWTTIPIARLKKNEATKYLVRDLKKFKVNVSQLFITPDGSTPIIIHRVGIDKLGNTKHRFEFKNPEDGRYLPGLKPILSSSVDDIFESLHSQNMEVFYFDRVSRATIELAKLSKKSGSSIFFEPSNLKMDPQTKECFEIADIVKFSNERIEDYEAHFQICERALEIITLGAGGLQYRTLGMKNWHKMNGFAISELVDAAGSGDWCSAGIIHNLFQNSSQSRYNKMNVEAALNFGQCLGAINCQFLGARGVMYQYNFNEIIKYIDEILQTKTISFTLNTKPQKSKKFLQLINIKELL